MQGLVLVGEFVAPSLEKTLGKWRQFIHMYCWQLD